MLAGGGNEWELKLWHSVVVGEQFDCPLVSARSVATQHEHDFVDTCFFMQAFEPCCHRTGSAVVAAVGIHVQDCVLVGRRRVALHLIRGGA